jgi:hypothetical protein
MAEPKTQPTKEDVKDFLNSVEPEQKRADGLALCKLFKKITKENPVMWGASIVGFGDYHYKSERSAQEGDWFLVGFSPRKQNLTLYLHGLDPGLLKKLGKHKLSGGMGGCLYINKLTDVDHIALASLVKTSFEYMKKKHR